MLKLKCDTGFHFNPIYYRLENTYVEHFVFYFQGRSDAHIWNQHFHKQLKQM